MRKVCTQCNVEKEVTEFHKQKGGKYGVRGDCKACLKKYYENNREKVKKYKKEYQIKNREKTSQYSVAYQRERRQNDPVFRMIKNYRRRTGLAYTLGRKSKGTMELLGCNGKELAQHLEKQFQPGMTHDNYGEWHIDHIKPIASFDLSDPEQEQECFHYTNLQPLWAEDNLSKGHRQV